MTIPQTIPSVADALDLAAGYIEEHGLAHNVYEEEDGSVCAEGAIRRILGIPNWPGDIDVDPREAHLLPGAYERLAQSFMCIKDSGVTAGDAIVAWNDYSSQETVVNGLREAARHARRLHEGRGIDE